MLQVCVSNRAKKIKTIDFSLLYVPANENPADYTTKTTSIDKYISTEFWQNGPNLLRTYLTLMT